MIESKGTPKWQHNQQSVSVKEADANEARTAWSCILLAPRASSRGGVTVARPHTVRFDAAHDETIVAVFGTKLSRTIIVSVAMCYCHHKRELI